MEVNYIDHMGTDLSVVNAARVSFNKKSDWEYKVVGSGGHTDPHLSDRDTKLVNYLANHGHWTPFGHTSITLHMKLPMFVQRQMDKHQVGFVVNEVSRRYVDDTPEFFEPEEWRARPDASIKQGSGDTVALTEDTEILFDLHYRSCLLTYETLLKENVAPEMARVVLPMSTYTETWKTGSLVGWSRVYNLRKDAHAQKEIQDVAHMINDVIAPLFPVSWKALTDG